MQKYELSLRCPSPAFLYVLLTGSQSFPWRARVSSVYDRPHPHQYVLPDFPDLFICTKSKLTCSNFPLPHSPAKTSPAGLRNDLELGADQ